MSLEVFSDEAILALVAQSDQEALAVLYDRYASAMLGLSRRMGFDQNAQEDCVQEIFLRIWNKASSFNHKKASGRSWILAVGHHYCVDRVRQEASRPKPLEPIADDDSDDQAFDIPGPGLNEEAALNRVRIARAMKTLDQGEQAVVELLHYRGFTYPEAAKALNVPLGTFKARVGRAMAKLREALHEA